MTSYHAPYDKYYVGVKVSQIVTAIEVSLVRASFSSSFPIVVMAVPITLALGRLARSDCESRGF